MPISSQSKQKDNTTPTSRRSEQPAAQQSTALSPISVHRRAHSDPGTLTPGEIEVLQRTMGNRATTRLLRPLLQRQELTLGPADDEYEREADRVAQQVVRQIDDSSSATRQSQLQRHNLEDEENIQSLGTTTDGVTTVAPATGVQRMLSVRRAPGDEPLHGPEGGAVEQSVQQQIQAARGGGKPLADGVRSRMESGFGADFSSVRVHTGSRADSLNRSLNARAFTTGSDVFFKRGEYNPSSTAGQSLLAHELTHTLQQGGAGLQRTADSTPPRRHQAFLPAIKRKPLPVSSISHPTLQRMAFDDPPSTWAPTKVSRSGEGVAGVYFVKENADMVVVKPMSSNEAAGTEFANSIMENAMQLEAPQTVTYPKTSGDGTAITNLLVTNADTIEAESGRVGEVQQQVDGAQHYMVMSAVQGKSIQTLDDDGAEDFITNAEAMKGVGRIMVGDAFLGNGDRLLLTQNLGNFFYDVASGMVATIDNDMDIGGHTITRSGKLGGDLDNRRWTINLLLDPEQRQGYIQAFIKKFRTSHTNQGNANAVDAIDEDFISTNIGRGIDEGFRDMAQAFTDNINLVRSLGSINAKYGDNTGKRNYDSAKGLAHYVKARTGGEDEKDATEKLRKYVEYRAKRNKKSKGFKWWAKLTNKTGF